jgi:hypothetical protein
VHEVPRWRPKWSIVLCRAFFVVIFRSRSAVEITDCDTATSRSRSYRDLKPLGFLSTLMSTQCGNTSRYFVDLKSWYNYALFSPPAADFCGTLWSNSTLLLCPIFEVTPMKFGKKGYSFLHKNWNFSAFNFQNFPRGSAPILLTYVCWL